MMPSAFPLSLILTLVVSGPPPAPVSPVKAKAGEAVVIPSEVKVYFPVVVQVKDVSAAAQSRFRIKPAPVWKEQIPNGVRFTGPPGVYHVDVLCIDFDAKKYVESEGDVTIVGDAPTPPPGPGPKPPPTPTDPDYLAIKAAYDIDTPVDAGLKRLSAALLVKYYRDAATACNTSQATTIATFFADINAIANAEATGLGLPKTRAVVSGVLRTIMGGAAVNGTLPVTDVQRKSLGVVFNKYADFVQEAAK